MPLLVVGAVVLIVEDDAAALEIYSTFFRHHGFDVRETCDGGEGYRFAKQFSPAVILMDLSMPGVDGFEGIRRLKEDPTTSSIPVIAVTAHAFGIDQENAIRAGFDGYITKPIEPQKLLEETKRWLGIMDQ